MSHEGWYSKKDVIQDLKTATGKSLSEESFNEQYVIMGEKPPPFYHMADEEGDMQISKLCCGQEPLSDSDIVKPDLKGITQMIRMFDKFYERPSIVSRKDFDDKLVKNTIISISKLNPNVKDFIPKNSSDEESPNTSDKGDLKCTKKDVITKQAQTSDVFENEKEANIRSSTPVDHIKEINKTDVCESNSSGRIDVSCLTPSEIQMMKEKLKTKISGTSKAKCVQVKRERNLAIATLVKLHCQTPNTTASGGDKIHLITPDYYQQSPSNQEIVSEIKETVKKSNSLSDTAQPETDILTKNPVHYETLEPILDSKSNQLSVVKNTTTKSSGMLDNDKTIKTQSSSTPTLVKENSIGISKEVRESIEKVENWFQRPSTKEKGPQFYVGPVTFKRKVSSKPMSPISSSSDNSKVQKSESYVPSQYANQLSKQYMERNKAREIGPDLWMKLEKKLKSKDEEIRNQSQVIV